jgi:putative oxidoreductase
VKNASGRIEGAAYVLLRAVAGVMFACHGLPKLFGLFGSGPRPAIGSQLWVGGLIELGAGVLIALGLFTRVAAIFASGAMAVAYFQFHWKLQLTGGKWLPLVNRGELAALYSFLFLFIAARGAGAASLDRRLRT